ncbi:MAG: hypothetical protein RJA36_2296 [Pseudomonadota bacterium]
MTHTTPGRLELARKVAHRSEDRDHLLRVVHDVIGLLAQLQRLSPGSWTRCGGIAPSRIGPDSQSRSHFLRQENGKPQQAQVLLGSSDFFLTLMNMPFQRGAGWAS